MAFFYFHRNPFKSTTPVDFELKLATPDTAAIKVLSELRQSRSALIQLLPILDQNPDRVEDALKTYLSLLYGFKPADAPTDHSKLAASVGYKWTHTMLPAAQAKSVHDVHFEIICMCQNVAFWFMKHAAKVASSSKELSGDDMKRVHTALKKAASLLQFVETSVLPELRERPQGGSANRDIDARLMCAYTNQCTGEAQEITLARAVDLKHKPGLISQLANTTYQMFNTAANAIQEMDVKVFGKWHKYLLFKAHLYLSAAYTYSGENLLSLDKCGESIRAIQESVKHFDKAGQFWREYSKIKGPGGAVTSKPPSSHPEECLFFRRFGTQMKLAKDKAERENGLIFHQKVPVDPPLLEKKEETYGLVKPDAFAPPQVSSSWTNGVYAALKL